MKAVGRMRGFCGDYGAPLFRHRQGSAITGVAAGAVNPPAALRLAGHIHVADKGAYDDITERLAREDTE